VIPLSTNSGLIGWVPDCDTLHTLIRDYREKKKIMLNIEHRIMLRVSKTPVLLECFPNSYYYCFVTLEGGSGLR
jgi:phosphatidylinositol kinase/protein kinase (PI-3  family)